MYVFLDILLLVVHSALVVFNLTGWIWPRTRIAHLVTISTTMASWLVLGFFHGFGYCPLTDWHWDVKRELGQTGLPASWFKHYADAISGMDWNPMLIDGIVAAAGIAAFVVSVLLNLRDRRKASASPA